MTTTAACDVYPPLRFNAADVQAAHRDWGCNCGPSAIAAALGMTLGELRPHIHDFEAKGYTNPTLMYRILDGLIGRPAWCKRSPFFWPDYGLARIQAPTSVPVHRDEVYAAIHRDGEKRRRGNGQ